jgi:hypothetical protein
MKRILLMALVAISLAVPSAALDGARKSAMRSNVEKVFEGHPGRAVIWKDQGDGTVRDSGSGMICPGELTPGLPLFLLTVPESDKDLIFCMYRSEDTKTMVTISVLPGTADPASVNGVTRSAFMERQPAPVSVWKAPEPVVPSAWEELFTTVRNDKNTIDYYIAAPAGHWHVIVHLIAGRPDPLDPLAVRTMPAAQFVDAVKSVEAANTPAP